MTSPRREPLYVVFLALLPALRIAGAIPGLFAKPPPGLHQFRDFHVFWLAGHAYATSGHVYPSLAAAVHPPAALDGNLFVYPAPSAALFAPLGLLPYPVAAAIFCLVSVAALWGALRLLGVTDWRCYGSVALWPATPASVLVGTLTPLLALCLALLWRFRDRSWAAATVTAVLLVTKVFLWPLAVWLGATRRLSTAFAAVALAVGVSVLAWLPIGGLAKYPGLLHALSLHELGSSYQLVRLLPGTPSTHLAVLEFGAVVAAGGLVWACRRLDHASSFGLAVGVALLFSPIVWLHYATLLVVPLALRKPRFSWLWLMPLVLWVYPFETTSHDVAPVVVFAAVALAATVPWPRITLRRRVAATS
jgi:alpha-1,2-mannosyltransferase